jgi:hypothetical protein
MTGWSLNSDWTGRMDSDTCNEILARFPGPVTLYPSRRKWLLLMVGCLLFAVGGAVEAYNGDAKEWLGVAFFGLGAIVPGLMLLHGAASLRLDADGFLEQVRSLRQRQNAKLDLDARQCADHDAQCAVGRHLWLQRR